MEASTPPSRGPCRPPSPALVVIDRVDTDPSPGHTSNDVDARARNAAQSRSRSRRPSNVSVQQLRRIATALWAPRSYRQWKSPILMIAFLFLGFGTHRWGFLQPGESTPVSDCHPLDAQIRSLKPYVSIGTACAFLAQLALTSSVWRSYTQWLWRSVYSHNGWTINGLNKAFSADTAPSSIFSCNMLRNFRLGPFMALFAWCLILPSFFTPAALFVYPSVETVAAEESVPYLAIANSSAGSDFAYSPPRNSSTTKFKDDTSRIFTGPRTVLTLLAGATASQGEILPIQGPTNHSAYSVDFYGPIVKCGDANQTAVSGIERLLSEHMAIPKGTTRQVDSAYFGFVPVWNTTGDLIALSQPRYQEPSNGTNELWMTFQRYTLGGAGERTRARIFQVCRLYNATYDLSLKWDRGRQIVNGSYSVREEITFPRDRRGEVSDMASHAYAAFMWTLTDQLVGSFGWFRRSGGSSDGHEDIAQFGAIESPIRHTSVLGSVDLDVYFDFNAIYGLYVHDNETEISGQRLQDKQLARNRTLAALIEELSYNMTVSLLHNKLLTHNTTRQVTRWNDVNRYGYNPMSLFIPYALANLVVLISAILGLVSFRHGTHPDKTFQDIANAAGEPLVTNNIRDFQAMPRQLSVDELLVSGDPGYLSPGSPVPTRSRAGSDSSRISAFVDPSSQS
ncbi:hypothetical protein S40285_02735 [Stachybotrys chlorohalonatus IBT 40285]|uniref:Uncharacterized protein n=1 Tax=Stachybotrys chlorohalonatus (strain IBT 40285) TaxID=1283841 RepID=A0A084QAH6_STAC4|nr:hypothetical protein S40285_02735 [Stachybotrys chlorohalonata IBT 40285]